MSYRMALLFVVVQSMTLGRYMLMFDAHLVVVLLFAASGALAAFTLVKDEL